VAPVAPVLEAAVNSASSGPVTLASAQLGTVQLSWPFLPAGNPILEGRAIAFVESLFGLVPGANQKDELAQYLALSTATHALDGWRYISQAALSLLSGSKTQSVHLAYYAELRAALAILASSGVGILNAKHFAMSANKDVAWFGGIKTHDATWSAIKHWARQPGHGLEILRCFSSLGLTGEDWAEACGATSTATLQDIAEYWVSDWTVDLSTLSRDRRLRNEASYRPNLRSDALDLTSEADLRFVRDVCAASIPIDHGEFDVVDRAIVYDLFKKSYQLLQVSGGATFLRFREAMVDWIEKKTGKPKPEAIQMIDALRTAFRGQGGDLVTRARRNSDATGVFSRAFLLLRLASALVRLQWKEARLLRSPQEWQDQLLVSYASQALLHDHKSPTKNYTIFAADQEQAIEEIDGWMSENVSAFNPYTLWDKQSHSLVNLCKFERIGAVAVAI
jgi:hypothetical protein